MVGIHNSATMAWDHGARMTEDGTISSVHISATMTYVM
jgi:hypothetical protein